MCYRMACAIQLENSVIITGGGYWSQQKRVQEYNLAGSVARLPDLCSEYPAPGNFDARRGPIHYGLAW